MRHITIFYVWQSDVRKTRNKITRALERVAEDLNVPEVRTVAIDQDTRSTTGAVVIDHVILNRIAAADVVVADVTAVTSLGNKALPNPNVMFEVGYAVSASGAEHVLLVRDVSEGVPGEMPFDIRNRETFSFGTKGELQQELHSRISQIIDRGPSLPAMIEERKRVIRQIDQATQPTMKKLGSELELLAETQDDIWARAGRFLSGPKVQWKATWHYGSSPENELLADLRRILLPSTNTVERLGAMNQAHLFLDGVERWKPRSEALKRAGVNASWWPGPQTSSGSYGSSDNTARREEWLDDVALLGVDTTQAMAAHEQLRESGDRRLFRVLGAALKALADDLRTLDPCLEIEVFESE